MYGTKLIGWKFLKGKRPIRHTLSLDPPLDMRGDTTEITIIHIKR